MAKSLAGWTWRSYAAGTMEFRDIDFGACSRAGLIKPEMELNERQAVGGRYGATQNALKTFERVKGMLKALRDEGRSLALRAMAEEFEMSVNTIRKYMDFALEEIEKATGVPVSQIISRLKKQGISQRVKTVHQGRAEEQNPSSPDLIAERDGEVEWYWIRPGAPGCYYDRQGKEAYRRFIDPHVTWRAEPEPPPSA